jgi:cellulose synthase operon protein C
MIRRLLPLIAVLAAFALAAGCSDGKRDALATAKVQLDKRDVKAAIITLKAALQSQPNAPALRFLMGKALLQAGDAPAALVELRKAKELGHAEEDTAPELVKALTATGRAEEASKTYGATQFANKLAMAELQTALAAAWGLQGQAPKMRAAIDQALALNPEHATASVVKARFLAGESKLDESWKIIDAVLKRDPKMVQALHFKGILLRYQKQDTAGAAAAQREALKLEPTLMAAHSELLSMSFEAKDTAGMRKQLEAMKTALPRNLNTFIFQAQLEFLDNKLPRARELVQQLLRVKTPDTRVLLLAAQIEMRNGSYTLAETYLTRLLNEAPGMLAARPMLAAAQLRLGQTDKALRTLQPLLETPNPPASVLGLAAEAYLHSGVPAKAQDYFAKAAATNPQEPRLRAALALNRVAQGDAAQGLSELERVAEGDKTTFADLALISTLMRRQEWDPALAAIQRGEKKDAKSPLFAHMRGLVLNQKKDAAGARASFVKALEVDPTYFPAAYALGSMDVAANNLAEAKKHFEALLKRDASNPRALLALADLKQRSGDPKEQVLAMLVDAAKKNATDIDARSALVEYHLRAKDYKAALSAGQDALSALPDNPTLLDAVGRSQFAAAEYQQAISTFRKLSAVQPTSPLPHLRLADVYAAQGDRATAVASLQRALEVSPDLLSAQVRQMRLFVDEKRYADAIAVARRVQQARPKAGVGHLLEADVWIAQKKLDAATVALRASMSREPSTEAAVKLHGALLNLGKTADAASLAQDWRAQHPKDSAFVLHLGGRAIAAKDWSNAETLYAQALEQLPQHAGAHNNMAMVLMYQKKPGALAFAEKANKLAPNNPAIMDTMAAALADAGQLDKAMELQKKVVAAAPNFMGAKLTLARIAIKTGDKKLARAELEKLAYLGDKFAAQPEVAELMRTLQ